MGEQAYVRERAEIGAGARSGAAAAIDNDVTIGARRPDRSRRLRHRLVRLIEDDVFVGPGVTTTNDNTMARHPATTSCGARAAARLPGRRRAASSCPGIEVGDGAFVAPGSVVTRDVAARGARGGRAREAPG